MGTPDFSVPILEAVHQAGHKILAVYCQPPRPAKRGLKEQISPIQAFAENHHFLIRTPLTLRNQNEIDSFYALKPDLAIVVAYGLILPPAILEIPRFGCLNAHASLLPRWRGAAPLHRAIAAGDSETGVTIMRMDQGLDTGPILMKSAVTIDHMTTLEILHDKLSHLSAELIVKAIEGIEKGTLTSIKQPEEGSCYAHKISKEESRLDWTWSANRLECLIRAFNPNPGTWFTIKGERFKILAAKVKPSSNVLDRTTQPGTFIDDHLTILCGEGALQITEIQRSGKAPISAENFLRGYPIPSGTEIDRAL
jgi:methionyl-tRNA formyltransferase